MGKDVRKEVKTMFEFFESLRQGVLGGMKSKLEDFLEDTREQIRVAVERAVKKAILGLIMMVGVIFALVGLAKYLSETVPSFANGIGYIVLGLALLFIAIIAKVLSTN